MNKIKFIILILLPIIFLLLGTVAAFDTENTESTVRKYTKFNVTANINDTAICDVSLGFEQCFNQCYNITKFFYRIEPDPTDINRVYFCPTKPLANCDGKNTSVSLCWLVTCAPNNVSFKVDASYNFLCVDPNPTIQSTLSNSSNSIKEFLNIFSIVFSSFIVFLFCNMF